MIKISCIIPQIKDDYLVNTVIDGLSILEKENKIEWSVSSLSYKNINIKDNNRLNSKQDFINSAKQADIILLFWSKSGIDLDLIEQVGCFNKTIFIDGSELGRNKRLDKDIVQKLNNLTWEGQGKIYQDLLNKCAGYFRREKPYINGIKPFPFGIERKYIGWNENIVKDIDFVCIFGQEQYPPLRKKVRKILENFCKKNELVCVTEKTKTRDEFYNILARAKVGISVSGGGYDTARFWEILGNNCILLTEKIDIYNDEDKRLQYNNIYEFNNENDFEDLLIKITQYLRTDYNINDLKRDYENIINNHSSKARVNEIIDYCRDKGIIK
jgi:preprotein translocase subunit Sss1